MNSCCCPSDVSRVEIYFALHDAERRSGKISSSFDKETDRHNYVSFLHKLSEAIIKLPPSELGPSCFTVKHQKVASFSALKFKNPH